MTEFEMAYLFNDMFINLVTQVQFYFAVLTAFLAASYVAAHRLTRSMTVVVVGLFAVVSVGSILNIYRQVQAMAGLAETMRAAAASGKGLAWHPVASQYDWQLRVPRGGGVAFVLLAGAAAVYFFFHCRHVNRKAEAGTWKPKV
jgi:hypothetical protein